MTIKIKSLPTVLIFRNIYFKPIRIKSCVIFDKILKHSVNYLRKFSKNCNFLRKLFMNFDFFTNFKQFRNKLKFFPTRELIFEKFLFQITLETKQKLEKLRKFLKKLSKFLVNSSQLPHWQQQAYAGTRRTNRVGEGATPKSWGGGNCPLLHVPNAGYSCYG